MCDLSFTHTHTHTHTKTVGRSKQLVLIIRGEWGSIHTDYLFIYSPRRAFSFFSDIKGIQTDWNAIK